MHLPDIDAASRALFRVGRSLAHRPAVPDVELSGILVAQAVAEAREQGREATIAEIATVLAVEHSTASRRVARSRQAGLVLFIRLTVDWNTSERESFLRQFLRFAEALSCGIVNPALAPDESENA